MTADPKRAARLEWTGEGLRFRGAGTHPVTPEIEIDGDGESSASPMIALLIAAAACSSIDVVMILQKMRVNLTQLSVDIEGVRRDADPRRFDALHLRFRLNGDALDQTKAERAVSLSVEKYCSVVHSLAPDIALSYDVDVS